jgi:hypothetical protein
MNEANFMMMIYVIAIVAIAYFALAALPNVERDKPQRMTITSTSLAALVRPGYMLTVTVPEDRPLRLWCRAALGRPAGERSVLCYVVRVDGADAVTVERV